MGNAANAIASLSGPPLTERRFLLDFPGRAEAVNRPGLFPGMLGLLGAADLEAGRFRVLAAGMGSGFSSFAGRRSACPPASRSSGLLPGDRSKPMLRSGNWQAALWPLLYTWTLAVRTLEDKTDQAQSWQAAFARLGLAGEGLVRRLEGLDAYLDMVEEAIDAWARANGVQV